MRATASFAAVWLLTLAVTHLGSAAEFYALGDLPGGGFSSVTGGVGTYTFGGLGVVGSSTSATGPEAFFWTPTEGMIPLGDLPGGNTESYATQFYARDGPITGWSASASGTEAFVVSRKYNGKPWEIVGIGDLPGGDFFSQGLAIYNEVLGATYVAGRSSSVNGMDAFLWSSDSGIQSLGDLPGGEFFSEATAVLFGGDYPTVFGQSSSNLGTEAFRWTAENGMQGLGTLPGASDSVITAAENQSLAVGYATTPTGIEAFIWESEDLRNPGMRSIGTFGSGTSTRALGVDHTRWGTAVVGTATTQQGDRAFIWTDNLGLRDLQTYLTEGFDLDLAGWTLNSAQGIRANDSFGQFVAGTGINPQGETEAWAARINFADSVPPPEVTAQMITLPDGNVAWEVGLQFHDNRHSAAAIDLKFEGEFVQIDGHVDDLSIATFLENVFGFDKDVDDVVMATILDGLNGFDKQADSWFYLDTSGELGAWTQSLPSDFGGNNPADPPWLNNLGEEIGLGGIDGLMPGESAAYISAGTGALSSFLSGPIAHFVLPADDYLTVTGIVARDGSIYDISQTFSSAPVTTPEPPSVVMLALGGLFLIGVARRRL